MNRSLPARGRKCRRLAILAAALLSLAAGAATAAEAASAPAAASPSQRLQQRFVASVEGWRKTAPKLTDKKPTESPPAHEAQLLRELRVVVAPTAMPLLRVQRRGGGHTLIVSAGWLALLDELLRAEAAYEAANAMVPGSGEHCPRAYLQSVLAVLGSNRVRADEETPQPLQAWPRLASWLEAGDTPTDCKRIKPSLLRSAPVELQVSEAADAASLWLLTRQAAQLAEMRVPEPAAAASAAARANAAGGAAKDDAASGWRLSCNALATHPAASAPPPAAMQMACSASAAPAATAAAAKTVSKPGGAAVPPSPAASTPDQLARHALNGWGLKLPAALVWLRDNAPELFR